MKNHLMKWLLFIIFSLLSFNILFADDHCGEILNCNPNQAYPYQLCNRNTGERAVCCFIDPNNYNPECEWYSIEDGYNLWKQSIPICLEFIDDSEAPTEISLYLMCSNVCPAEDIRQVFRKDWTHYDAEKAGYEWNCVCGKQNEPCACPVKVKFYKDRNKIGFDPLDYECDKFILKYGGSDNKCPSICDNATIYLNNTEEFKHYDRVKQTYQHFYVNDKFFEDNEDYLYNDNGCGYGAINLTDALTVAAGQLLGLGYYNMDMYQTSAIYAQSCVGIMNTTEFGGNKSVGLSNDDKCMFARLYCPEITSDINELQLSEILFFPNPVSDILVVSFPDIVKKMTIYYIDGRVAMRFEPQEIKQLSANGKISIDVRSLSSGNYFLVINERAIHFIIAR